MADFKELNHISNFNSASKVRCFHISSQEPESQLNTIESDVFFFLNQCTDNLAIKGILPSNITPAEMASSFLCVTSITDFIGK